MKTLLKLDQGEVLIEILGVFERFKLAHPRITQNATMLVGRVTAIGDAKDLAYPSLAENDLVVIEATQGLIVKDGKTEYRLIGRATPLLVIDPDALADAGIEPEDLLKPLQKSEVTSDSAAPVPEPEPEPEPLPPPPPPMIQIEWINQRGQGFATRITVPEGTTLGGLLKIKGIEAKGRELRILKPNLGEVPPMEDTVLEVGDHVEAVPVEVGVGFGG